jgi:transcriptional regulator with XRE-family HTH domain
LGLTQKQAAERIGLDETSVYNWESNRIEPTVRFISHIHIFLGYCPYTPGLPVSERLKITRHGLGYSQERMARALKIDEGTWRQWEAGKRQPSGIYRGRIVAFLESLNGVIA